MTSSVLLSKSEGCISNEYDPEQTLDACLIHMGLLKLSEDSRSAILSYAESILDTRERITGVIRLLGSTKEFQMA